MFYTKGSCFSTYGTANLRAFVVFFETHFPSLPGAGVLETSTVIGLTHMWVRKLTPFWHPTRPTPGDGGQTQFADFPAGVVIAQCVLQGG